ncbi:NAD(P)-binding protein [Xylariaceae sp. FL1019]|nr:NAD(P)-binding protein [Xylariaceae sp. FL1019]
MPYPPVPPSPPPRTVLVLGAGGYIGLNVSRAFARAGWRVYGQVRRPEAATKLASEEITPMLGPISSDSNFVDDLLQNISAPVDVVVSCTETFPFNEHWEHLLSILTKVAKHAQKHDVKTLVLMTSGCKDYGHTLRHGDPNLAPHTEASPLEPQSFIKERCESTLKVFSHTSLFDAAVIRPTPLYGYGSSFYGILFDSFSRFNTGPSAASSATVVIPGDPNNIIHGCHITDCAAAYLSLATHPNRSEIAGQCFNISAAQYETAREIVEALAVEYGIKGKIMFSSEIGGGAQVGKELQPTASMFDITQWVDSTKLRQLTGWKDGMAGFTQELHAYRLAYEAAEAAGDHGVVSLRNFVNGLFMAGTDFKRDQK